MDIAKHRVDPALYVEGNWLEFDGGRFLVAAYNNPRHAQAISRLMREHVGKDPDELASLWPDIERRSYADGVLLDWQDVTDEGEPVAFSREQAEEMIKTCPHFAQWLQNACQDLANYRAKAEIAAGKA